jgi:hypothetical protein
MRVTQSDGVFASTQVSMRMPYHRRDHHPRQIVRPLELEARGVDLLVDRGMKLLQFPKQRCLEAHPIRTARKDAQHGKLVGVL